MSWSKMVAVSTVILFVFGFVTIDSVVAGEKLKWQGTSFTTETKKLEVGDAEGHVLLLTKSKQLYVAPDGTRSVGVSANTMDINPAMKQFSLKGWGWTVDKDGDKIIRTHEGQPVGKDHWKGTWTYVSGTGKYEGVKGNGIWDSYSMGQGQPSLLEVEGEVEMPKK